jgi:hypothetical protein
MIGVFEYGCSYISSETPYTDFLKTAASHLAPGGRLVIAIENRLGMKYFAGCTEDHTGRFFDGIEGYPETDSARTFSRKELEDLLRSAGLDSFTFYYPYPDYKLPMAVFSDRRLPKPGELRMNMMNFDRKRLVRRCRKCDPITIYRKGYAMGNSMAGSKKYLYQVLDIYNGSSQRLNLPLKF